MVGHRRLSEYLRETYGERVAKICIDGGFSCPNRDGTVGVGGCVFCGERGAGEHISLRNTDPQRSITEQVTAALRKYDEWTANPAKPAAVPQKFIAYFQNFSGTYADPTTLRQRYDAALMDERIVAFVVGTRPDCINNSTTALLAEYGKSRRVWVELGLQTASDVTARRINRGYPSVRFTEAIEMLTRHGIDAVVHLIIGLPGENFDDLRRTVDFVNRHRLWGIKIHSLYVMEGTRLAESYRRGEFEPISMDEYIERAVYVLAHTDPTLIVHRLTGDCPPNRLVAPAWNVEKSEILHRISTATTAAGASHSTEYIHSVTGFSHIDLTQQPERT